MRDIDQARLLLSKAREDLELIVSSQEIKIADSIFGFHAQQAVEKALKAWIAFQGREYPLTHNLARLMNLLQDQTQEVVRFSAPDFFEFLRHRVQV